MKTLTSQDIKAMKTADRVIFRCINGQSTLELKKAVKDDPWRNESTYDFELNHYLRNFGGDGSELVTAFDWVSSAQFDGNWLTVAHCARVGDEMHLNWIRNNDSEQMRADGYVRDELHIELRRPRKNGYLALWFQVASYVGPDNTARMTREVRQRQAA